MDPKTTLLYLTTIPVSPRANIFFFHEKKSKQISNGPHPKHFIEMWPKKKKRKIHTGWMINTCKIRKKQQSNPTINQQNMNKIIKATHGHHGIIKKSNPRLPKSQLRQLIHRQQAIPNPHPRLKELESPSSLYI